jgi:hypothetical protein
MLVLLVSLARYTSPIGPAPSDETISNGPRLLPGMEGAAISLELYFDISAVGQSLVNAL